ncbi:Ribosomal RNA small subunit methyltransferase H [Candidatus Providencia siddallii]|uniref:Ribosomal RNA small subunit methyltransferase H n=1 Tax=Candidatus Providencia siddallii TaxID=1715285 RepID=A0A0M6W6L5_9GAMM|nr:Ribosomal RNA small subunit methyltransferase H [Candidatus Providencia siddallii]
MIKQRFKHITVLLEEAIEGLKIKSDGVYIDGTFGQGGHSKLLLKKLGKNGRLIAIDRDPEAIKAAESINDHRFIIKHGLFSNIINYTKKENVFGKIDGILLDLGVSSMQIDNPDRGFSFRFDGPLDMRMDTTNGQTALQWLMSAKIDDIISVLKSFGEERYAKHIAKAIVEHNHNHKKKPLTRTNDLVNLILKINKTKYIYKHQATRTFQAIRIYINNELNEIKQTLNDALTVLALKGRICVISFHSLEDRIVKQFIKEKSRGLEIPYDFPLTEYQIKELRSGTIQLKNLGKIKPSNDEIHKNPRSRSSILRLAEKTNNDY